MNGSGNYHLAEVPMQELHAAPHQPPSRTESSNPLNALKRSIAEIGLMYPPLVIRNPDGQGFTVADGHRRLAALKLLEWQTVPVLISQGKPDRLFAEVSGTVRAISANQWIYVYLHGGSVPSGPTRSNIVRLDATMGREFLERLCDAGLSPQIWTIAAKFLKYTGLDDEQKKPVLEWLLTHKLTQQVASWVHGANPVEELCQAFAENRKPVLVQPSA